MGPDLHSNPIGCSLLPVQVSQGRKEQGKIARDSGKLLFQHQDQIKIKKRIKKRTKENRKKYLRQLQSPTGKTGNQAKERQIPSSSGPVWECDSETRRLGVRKLLRNECLDLFMPVETRSPNHILQSYSELVDRLKNDRKFREFHEPTDKGLIDQENREYFNKTNGLVNYLYHPDKICAVMEDTGFFESKSIFSEVGSGWLLSLLCDLLSLIFLEIFFYKSPI
ncbi:unnamed protein product [Rhizophagus irregularis]|nr:unnamed protein product [Rhizophagus irregularis]